MKVKTETQRTALSGILIALSTILSFITVYRLPHGGSITLLSMLPIMLLSYMYGVKWGFFCGVVYSAVQALLGTFTSGAFAGQNAVSIVLILLIDYVLAFGSLGLAGVFKNKIKKTVPALVSGIVVSGIVRYIWHIISGAILYGSYAEWYFTQDGFPSFGEKILSTYSGTALVIIYSAIYNGSYMIPEIILTTVGACIIIPVITRDKRINALINR